MPDLLQDVANQLRVLRGQIFPTVVNGGPPPPPTTGALLGSTDNRVTATTSLTQQSTGAFWELRRDGPTPAGPLTPLGALTFGGNTDAGFADHTAMVMAFPTESWTAGANGTSLRLYVTPTGMSNDTREAFRVQGTDYGPETLVPAGPLRLVSPSTDADQINDGLIRQAFGLELWQARHDLGTPAWRDVGTPTGSFVQGDTTITIPGGGLTQADVGRYMTNSAGDATDGSVTIPDARNYVRAYITAVSADGTQATLQSGAVALAGPPLDPSWSMINVQFTVSDTQIGSPLHIAINDYHEGATANWRSNFFLNQNRGPRGIIQIDGTTTFGSSGAAAGMPIAFQTGQVFTSKEGVDITAGLGAIGFNFSSQMGAAANSTITLTPGFGTAFVDNWAFTGGVNGLDTTWKSFDNQVGVFGGSIIGHHVLIDAIGTHLTFGSVLGSFTGLHVADGPGDSRTASGTTTFGSTAVTTTSDIFDSTHIGRRITGITGLINDCFAPDTLITAVTDARHATVSHPAIATSTAGAATFTIWVGTIGNMVGVDIEHLTSGGINTGIRNASTTVFTPRFQNVSATQSIMPDASCIYITSAAPVTLPSENITTYNAQDGQTLEIVNIGAYPVTFTNGQGVFLGSSATMVMQPLDSAQFSYRGSNLGIAGQLWNLERPPGGSFANVLRLDGVFNEVTAFGGYYGTQSFGTGLSTLTLQHARGTKAAPAYVHSLDTLQVFAFQGYNDIDNAYQNAASILAYATEDYHTAGHYGGALAFAVSPPGSATPQAVMTLQNDFVTTSRVLQANVGVTAANGPLGLTYVATEYGATNVNQPAILDLRGGRGGSSASQLNLLIDVVGRIYFAGSTRSSSQPKVGVARIDAVASENWTDTGSPNFTPVHTGSQLQFYTTTNGTTSNHGDFAMSVDTTGINLAGGQVSSLTGIVTTPSLIQANLGVSAANGPFGLTFVGSEYGGAGVNKPAVIDLRGGRGTGSAGELNLLFDVVARFMFAGSTRNVANPKVGVASINAVASENWTDTGSPNFTPTGTGTDLQFWTTPNGTTTNHGQPAMTLANDGDLQLMSGVVSGATMKGGQVDPISGLHITSTYTQTVDQTSVPIGTPLFIEMNPTFNYTNARSATSVWGPRGMVHIGGTSRYAADLGGFFYIPPMGWNDAHVVRNSAGSARTMNFGWSNISSRNYLADGGTITVNQVDAATGPSAYFDSTAYLTRSSGTINGTTHSIQLHSYCSAPFVLGNAHFTNRAAYWVGDVNYYAGGDGTATMNAIFDAIYGSTDHGAGTVVNNYGVKIDALTFGTHNIGVSNAAGKVEVPQLVVATTSATTIDANASLYHLSGLTGNTTLTSLPWIAAGITGQRLRIVNLDPTDNLTLPSGVSQGAVFPTGNLTLAAGESVELEYGGLVWGPRTQTVGTSFTVTGKLASSGTAGVGYAPGAGGTVTQGAASGKATAVTLNKVCGTITMNAATLAASAAVSFTLTNSTIAATDTLVLNQVAGTAAAYLLNAQCAAGSATITIRNITIAALSEAVQLRFKLDKTVNA